MSQMQPQLPDDPAQLQAMLAQLGGPGGGQPEGSSMPPAQDSGEDWLVTAINAVHDGMVHESDPAQVSLLGTILSQLTTYQAKAHSPKQGAAQ